MEINKEKLNDLAYLLEEHRGVKHTLYAIDLIPKADYLEVTLMIVGKFGNTSIMATVTDVELLRPLLNSIQQDYITKLNKIETELKNI